MGESGGRAGARAVRRAVHGRARRVLPPRHLLDPDPGSLTAGPARNARMEPAKLPPEKVADMARMLQSSLKRRRPRPWLVVGGSLLTACLLLALLAWLLWPQPEPPRLEVVAFDAVYT